MYITLLNFTITYNEASNGKAKYLCALHNYGE